MRAPAATFHRYAAYERSLARARISKIISRQQDVKKQLFESDNLFQL